ncbi:MAG TPA: sigma-54 dependent transcriptional regulator [Longimicrobiales bacterium]
MSETDPRILVADDQPDVLHALRLLLRAESFDVTTASSPRDVAAAVAEQEFDVLLIDLNYTRDTTSGREGLDLLMRLQAVHPGLPVVVMTAYGTIDGAVEAMRRGARDFVVKPWDNDRLLATLRSQVELARALRRGDRAEAANRRMTADGRPQIIAQSRAMKPVLDIVERVAASDANVLITGEHGTGKEVVARWIHAGSARAHRPLVTVNASGLSQGVFESELFGHVKGAFTDAKSDRIGYFEMADGGTLFLDEIGDMPTPLQAKLLRVLQTGEFQRVGSSSTRRADVRVLSATNVDIGAEVRAGRFREDLLYRLNTVEIALPPLRERRDDIGPLAHHFLERTVARYGRRITGFDAEAMQAMLAYAWPGNVRELEHGIERAVLLARGERITADDLALGARAVRSVEAPAIENMELDEAERWLIRRALEKHDGNVSAAAESLGVSRSALYRRLQRYGLG